MGDVAELYAAGRTRIGELVRNLDEGEAKSPVPTCPEWTVADVVAHLTGVCADILAGNIAGVATDPWTDAQVEARRGRPIADLLAEWDEAAPQVEAIAEHFPGRTGEQWAFDLVCHEHDIRAALGRPGARDSEGVQRGLEFVVGGFALSVAGAGLPPLEVRTTEGRSWVVGDRPLEGTPDHAMAALLLGAADFTGGEAEASVTAPAFELLRAFSGRRSLDQIRGYDWSADAETWLPAFTFGPFRPSTAAIEE